MFCVPLCFVCFVRTVPLCFVTNISMNLTEKQLKELLLHFAFKHGAKLFNAKGYDINSTVINRIGKKRLLLIKIMLDGYQLRI